MRLSYNWLKELVKFDMAPNELASALTNQGLETTVDCATGSWTNVITARVLQTSKHPNADKLRLCSLTDGSHQYEVVCGASNVEAGQTVALAKIGAVLSGGFKIESRAIRGVQSEGMICSEKELGMADESNGIMVMPNGTPIGRPLEEITGGVDSILNLEITTNRSDCLSHWGVAREIAAYLRSSVNLPDIPKHNVKDGVSVTILNPELCGRYMGYRIAGVKIGPSPDWMARRLRNCGFRPLNNIVDITNFVLLELGHPLHAFDINCLNGRKIIVRRAKNGEKLKALDCKDYSLNDSMLVIADDTKPQAIAGIMGGETSGISDKTSTVLLESAIFDSLSIRRTSKALNLSSESSYRFERGVSWDGAELAARRAADMIVRYAGGAIEAATDEIVMPYVPAVVKLRHEKVKLLLGLDVPISSCKEILSCLGMGVNVSANTLEAHVPSWRHDITQEADLIEEIARINGYHNIPATVMPQNHEIAQHSFNDNVENGLRAGMAKCGFLETLNYSFTSEAQITKYGIALSHKVSNPLSLEYEAMRPSLISGLMANFEHNRSLGHKRIKLFETGRVFTSSGEHTSFGALAYGAIWPDWWKFEPLKIPLADYYYLSGIISTLFIGTKLTFALPGKNIAYLHPGKCADIMLNGSHIGHIGAVHPGHCQGYDNEIVYCEMDVDKIKHALNLHPVTYAPIKRFPPVKRDLSLIADKVLTYDKIAAFIERAKHNSMALEDVRLFSVFESEKVGDDKISYALHLTFRHGEHTLADAEVTAEIEKLLSGLKAELGITLRS